VSPLAGTLTPDTGYGERQGRTEPMKYLHDIYRCVSCKSVAAHGNVFCRSCGIKFSPEDITEMKANVRSTFGACPWNFRDTYRCTHCSEHICISDNYCRRCGDKIDDKKKQLMKLNMAELA